jgi:hypothetical protein
LCHEWNPVDRRHRVLQRCQCICCATTAVKAPTRLRTEGTTIFIRLRSAYGRLCTHAPRNFFLSLAQYRLFQIYPSWSPRVVSYMIQMLTEGQLGMTIPLGVISRRIHNHILFLVLNPTLASLPMHQLTEPHEYLLPVGYPLGSCERSRQGAPATNASCTVASSGLHPSRRVQTTASHLLLCPQSCELLLDDLTSGSCKRDLQRAQSIPSLPSG